MTISTSYLANQLTLTSPATTTTESPGLPAQLGKYQLRAVIGRGGMGVVYEGHDTLLQRDVAIKVISPAAGPDVAGNQLLREARTAAALNHPNIVAIYDAGETPAGVYIAMELVRGVCAWQYLQRHGPFSWQEATQIIAEVCYGLSSAHAGGVIHRDIKPANILLVDKESDLLSSTNSGYRPRAKLADFGLSRSARATESVTLHGQVVGTPHYMSPEQIRGETLDERSDIYALGATYYTLLTGRYPFEREQIVQVLFAHCSAARPDPRDHDPSIPPAVSEVIACAMAKEPRERYSAAAAMAEALVALLPFNHSEAQPTTIEKVATAPTFSYGLWLGAAAAVVAMVVGVLWWWPDKPSLPQRKAPSVASTVFKTTALPSTWAALADGSLEVPGELECLRVATDGKTFAMASSEGEDQHGRLALVELATKRSLGNYAQHKRYASPSSIAFVDDRFVLLAYSEGVIAYNRQTNDQTMLIELRDGTAHAIACSAQGALLAVGVGEWGGGGRVELYDLKIADHSIWVEHPRQTSTKHRAAVRSVAFAPDGRQIAAASEDGAIVVSSVADQTLVAQTRVPDVEAEPGPVGYALAFAPAGRFVAAGGHRGIVLLDTDSGERIVFPADHPRAITAVAFSSDSSMLASASTDGIRLWKVADRWQLGLTIDAHQGNVVNALAFVHNDTQLISAGFDRRVRFWDLANIGRKTE